MSDSQVVVTIRRGLLEDIDRIEPLWQALYKHQVEHGMLLRLPDGAFQAWVKSIAPFLDRFATLVVAEKDNEILGFVAGRVRALPPYFGSATIGLISEVFVSDSHRGGRIGRRLLALAVDWFRSQQITRIELQVVSGNPDGVRFYRQLGWHEELLQMVWDARQHPSENSIEE